MQSEKKNKTIAFLCPYPFNSAPGQRFRYEQYLGYLKIQGYDYQIFPFLDEQTNKILYKKGFFISKSTGIIKGFLRRIKHLFQLRPFDYVFIFREASPLGPPIFEWAIRYILQKKFIYDFDDAIWLPNTSKENQVAGFLKWHGKVAQICKWAYKISAGNHYLLNYAFQYNSNGIYNPTTVDTLNLHNRIKDQNAKGLVIGWTGSHSTLKYIDLVIPCLKELEKKYDFTFKVIADKDPMLSLKNYEFIKWNEQTEIEDLLSLNIGIMPLINDKWAQGKCGFKALQYMSLGIPTVASDVGANNKIIDQGINGYLCSSSEEWNKFLSFLIENNELRKEMGQAARKKIEESYSVQANKNNFLSLFAKN